LPKLSLLLSSSLDTFSWLGYGSIMGKTKVIW
jgi:hypothetical protein